MGNVVALHPASPNLESALQLASAGFSIFPCNPANKQPVAGFMWRRDASSDPAKVRAWWKQWPDAVPGLPTGARNGIAVVDLDVGKGRDGLAAYRALGLDPDSAALQVRTGGGGLHLYFDYLEGCTNTTSKAGLDIRGEGGYVIAPGAVTKAGAYTTLAGSIQDVPLIGLTPFPAALRSKPRDGLPADSGERPNLPTIWDALGRIPNDSDYGTWVGVLMALHYATGGSKAGLAYARAWSADYPGYAQSEVDSKWASFRKTSGDLITAETLFAEARKHGWNMPDADDFDDEPDESPEPDQKPSGLSFLTPGECAAMPPRDYIVKGLIGPSQVGCIFGEPGAGKSVIAPYLAYAVAHGSEFFGLKVKAGGCFYIACEDESGMAARVTALHNQFGDAPGFKLVAGCSDLFSAGQIAGKGSPHLQAIRRAVKAEKPRLIIIDTLAMAMPGLEENDAAGMARVIAIGRLLARHGAAVIFIHHGTKAEGSTPRGHSVLNGALDFSIMVKSADQNGIVRGCIKKNRNGPPDLDIAFRIGSRVTGKDIDGESVSSPMCEPCDGGLAEPKLKPTEQAALAHMLDLAGDASELPEKEWRDSANDCLSISASDVRDNRRRVVTAALKGLVRAGIVRVEGGVIRLISFSASQTTYDWDDDDDLI